MPNPMCRWGGATLISAHLADLESHHLIVALRGGDQHKQCINLLLVDGYSRTLPTLRGGMHFN